MKNSPESYSEQDNVGTRIEDIDQSESFWMSRRAKGERDPFVLYIFESENEAREAMLELNCIHEACTSGKLICTELLVYGCYRRRESEYSAFICGKSLSHELWSAAKDSFTRHGGELLNDLEPEQHEVAAKDVTVDPDDIAQVEFVKEVRQDLMGHATINRFYKASTAAAAKAFLSRNPVTENMFYLIVETPEGCYGRDIVGMYEQ